MENQELKDHKQIGQELELYFTNEVAPGSPFWLPRGMVIFKELEKFIRELTEKAGYLETSTPIMVKSELFKQSGHWVKFGEHNMYNLPIYEDEELDEITKNKEKAVKEGKIASIGELSVPVANYSLKPMNCPESTILYRFRNRSYRELPLRLAEIGRLHRREKSGEVNGLLRVRQITMDDAHIFATEDQIQGEVANILQMMIDFYKSFNFEYEFRLATKPEQYAGTDENWSRAEKALEEALNAKNLKHSTKDKDGAFYGPKIDLHIKDALGREWQLATVQLDFHQPEAFDLSYVDETGKKQRPVMIHRAIFGSFERFIAILTENFQGAFPTWLAPVQTVVIPISDKHADYAERVQKQLTDAGVRAEVDSRSETMQNKIRTASQQKIPYQLVVGDREVEAKAIAVRTREGKDLGQMALEKFIEKLQQEISSRSL